MSDIKPEFIEIAHRNTQQTVLNRVLNGLEQIPFLRRASTQVWLLITNLFFLVILTAIVGAFVRYYILPHVRDEAIQNTKAEVERVANLVESAQNAAELQAYLRNFSYLTLSSIHVQSQLGTFAAQNGRDLAPIPSTFAPTAEVNFQTIGHHTPARWQFSVSLNSPHQFLVLVKDEPSFVDLSRRDASLLLGLTVLLAITMVVAASWLASYRITDPLKTISLTAKRINEGQLDEQIEVKSQMTELRDLTDSLNQMAHRFREDIREWERLTNFQNEFIGNVSHEVRNPIFSIGGYLEALASPNITPEMRKMYVNKGLNNVQRLNDLFSDLIEIARLEYKEDVVKPELFDLKPLVDEVADELDFLAIERKVDLLVDNETQLVFADRSRIRQVLMNLIQNAISYTDKPNGSVWVRYRRHGQKVRVEVTDMGRGIAEEHLDRIFDRFYRVDAARSRAMGGTGLGLSIVKQILNAHGEEPYVESTEGRGSRFWFDLPIHKPIDLPQKTG